MIETLTPLEQGEMRRMLGEKRFGVLLEASRGEKAPSGELTGFQDPQVTGTGQHLTQVQSPSASGFKRLSVRDLDALRLDAQINIGLEFHKLPLMTLKPEFAHPDPEIAAFLNHELERIGWAWLAREWLRSLDYGYYAAERIYAAEDTTIQIGTSSKTFRATVYERIKGIHPSGVQLEIDAATKSFKGFSQTSGGVSGEIVPDDKAMIYTFDEEYGNRYGNALTRRAYKWWWIQDLIYQFTNRYFEDQSIPQRKIYYVPNSKPIDPSDPSKGTTDANQAAALSVAEQSKSGSAVALPLEQMVGPNGKSWSRASDMEFMMGPNKASEFLPYLDHLDAKKLRAMLVPERLAQQSGAGATGSYGMLDSLTDFFMLRLEGIAADLYRFLVRGWAMPLLRYNFGSSAPPPTVSPPKLTSGNRALLEQLFTATVMSLEQSGQTPIDVAAIAKELGVPIPESTQTDDVTQQGEPNAAPDNSALPDAQRVTNSSRAVLAADHPGVRPATYGRTWETDTAAFQTTLGDSYTTWARQTAKLLAGLEPTEYAATLKAQLETLRTLMVKAYRSTLPEAMISAFGDELTPQSLGMLAQRLAALEKRIPAQLEQQIGARVLQDLAGFGGQATVTDLEALIGIRMKLGVIAPAGNDYWGTIVESWKEKRLEREADPSIAQGKLRWVLDPKVKNHCADCERLAGEYDSISSLPALPGDGSTACNIYCYCWLEEQNANGNWQRRISDL